MDSAPIDDHELQAAMTLLGSDVRLNRVEDMIMASANQPRFRNESERQPVSHNTLEVVADCRIDNADEVIESIGAANPLSDSRLIAETWHRHNTNTADRLLGDFALAVFDRGQKSLFLARDPVGVRPLFYYATPGRIAFATTIEIILALPGVPRVIDETEVAANLINYLLPTGARTYYRGVCKLKPGHWLKVQDGALTTRRYWEPLRHDRHVGLTMEQAAEGLNAELVRSVRARLQTDQSIGSHISGGLDSSALTLLSEDLLRRRNQGLAACYSWSPATQEQEALSRSDERQRIATVAEFLSAPIRYTSITADDIDAALNINPGFASGTLLQMELKVLEYAKRDGIGVLMSGWGGDEAASFNGRGYLAGLIASGQLRKALRAIKLRSTGNLRSALRITWGEAISPLVPRRLRYRLALQRMQKFVPHLGKESLIAATQIRPEQAALPLTRPGVFQTQRALICSGHLNERMEDWYWLGRKSGVVHVYPLLDTRLLEFIFGLAPEHFSAERQSRELFCQAVQRFLPATLPLNRFKQESARPKQLTQSQIKLLHTRAGEWKQCTAKSDWLNHVLVADSIRQILDNSQNDPHRQARLARLLAARRLLALC